MNKIENVKITRTEEGDQIEWSILLDPPKDSKVTIQGVSAPVKVTRQAGLVLLPPGVLHAIVEKASGLSLATLKSPDFTKAERDLARTEGFKALYGHKNPPVVATKAPEDWLKRLRASCDRGGTINVIYNGIHYALVKFPGHSYWAGAGERAHAQTSYYIVLKREPHMTKAEDTGFKGRLNSEQHQHLVRKVQACDKLRQRLDERKAAEDAELKQPGKKGEFKKSSKGDISYETFADAQRNNFGRDK